MACAADQLPDDIEQLKRLLLGREELITKLMAEIARLKRWRFGRSSERTDTALWQLQLLLEGMQLAAPAKLHEVEAPGRIPAEESKESSAASGRTGRQERARKRGELPEHLPRESIVHAPPSCACPDCGRQMRTLGEDIAEQLDYVPGYFRVLRHVRPKLACGHCAQIIQLPAPARPIERGLPTPALLAQVIVAKYADHSPLYRQQAIFRRAGVELDRSLMADWVGSGSALMNPLVVALGRYVLKAAKVHGDDTPIPVLDPGRGRTKIGRIWVYVRDDRPAGSRAPPAVWYRYSPDRKGEHPGAHLKTFSGILQADGYAGFAHLYESGRIVEAACMAHLRRKFYDLYQHDRSPLAVEALRRIGLLYAIEREIRGQLLDARRIARQQLAAPLLAALHDWLHETLRTVSAKSALAEAIRYGLARWTALTRYCDDGRIEIDNNTAERAIRPVVLGRKNYLFAGSDAGGARAANIYSLIGTCLLNGIEPYRYLREVLERIAQHPINRIDELLPWNLAATVQEPQRLAA
ncbi:MAG: IS66 family transposase [Burkholderiaceae bacterium]|jgi:transposase|nr:IS66 family transposase [Burkholderiaceae bacterium]